MKKKVLLSLLILPLISVFGQAERDTVIANKIGWMAYPYAFYTPETELAFGAGSLVYFRTSSQASLKPANNNFDVHKISLIPSNQKNIKSSKYNLLIIFDFYV